jgi:hypothetical protein
VEAVEAWLVAAEIAAGGLAARHASARPSVLGGTPALHWEAGASAFKMMEVSRHKSMDTLRGYVRRADLFRDHAGAAFLLSICFWPS